MFLSSLLLLFPVMALAVGGYVLTGIHKLDGDTLVRVIVDLLMPLLIFHSLYTTDISRGEIVELAGATTFVVGSLAMLAWLYSRLSGVDARELIPSVIFMNSGFLGIPVMQLWGGVAAMNLIVIYDQIQTVYIFTLGLVIIAGGLSVRGALEMVKSPILWSIFLGFAFRMLRIPLPEVVLTTMDFGGAAALPLAAFTLGVTLSSTRFHFDRHLFMAIALRFVAGFLCGWAGAELFGLHGVSRTVVIVASSLPTAVFTSVLPLRYGVKADFAGTMVVTTTLAAVITIPLAFRIEAML